MSHRALAWIVAAALALGALACDETVEPADAGGSETDAGTTRLPDTLGPAERPARLVTSSTYDGMTARPVIVLLHGYGANSTAQSLYWGLERETRRRDWLLILPEGTLDTDMRQFWNATPACCDFGATGVDDVAYLTGLLDELEAMAPVSDVYFVGHSNGGFMSYRMACELSDRVSAIASLAGSDFIEDTDCVPDQPVSVLQIHGDMDDTIFYAGSATRGYPPADVVVRRWATRAGCDSTGTMGAPLDLELMIAGDESSVLSYETGCSDAEAALWTIIGGAHIPGLSRSFTPSVLDWLEAHAR